VTPYPVPSSTSLYTSIIDSKSGMPHDTKADPTGATWLRCQRAAPGRTTSRSGSRPELRGSRAVPKEAGTAAPSYPTVTSRITTGIVPSLAQISGDITSASTA